MAKITVIIDSIDKNADEFYVGNDGAAIPQVTGVISLLARYLMDDTDMSVKDIVKISDHQQGLRN